MTCRWSPEFARGDGLGGEPSRALPSTRLLPRVGIASASPLSWCSARVVTYGAEGPCKPVVIPVPRQPKRFSLNRSYGPASTPPLIRAGPETADDAFAILLRLRENFPNWRSKFLAFVDAFSWHIVATQHPDPGGFARRMSVPAASTPCRALGQQPWHTSRLVPAAMGAECVCLRHGDLAHRLVHGLPARRRAARGRQKSRGRQSSARDGWSLPADRLPQWGPTSVRDLAGWGRSPQIPGPTGPLGRPLRPNVSTIVSRAVLRSAWGLCSAIVPVLRPRRRVSTPVCRSTRPRGSAPGHESECRSFFCVRRVVHARAPTMDPIPAPVVFRVRPILPAQPHPAHLFRRCDPRRNPHPGAEAEAA